MDDTQPTMQELERQVDDLLADYDRVERDPTPQPERQRELRRRRITDKLKNLLEMLIEQGQAAGGSGSAVQD